MIRQDTPIVLFAASHSMKQSEKYTPSQFLLYFTGAFSYKRELINRCGSEIIEAGKRYLSDGCTRPHTTNLVALSMIYGGWIRSFFKERLEAFFLSSPFARWETMVGVLYLFHTTCFFRIA